jgi:hypothetical protein
MKIHSVVSKGVTPCGVVGGHQNFGEENYLYLQCRIFDPQHLGFHYSKINPK